MSKQNTIVIQPRLELTFNKVQEAKNKIEDIKKMYKQALMNDSILNKLNGEAGGILQKIKDRKREIGKDFSADFNSLEKIEVDMRDNEVLISDLVLKDLLAGKMIENITGKDGKKYAPIFIVKFKKIKE